MGEFRVFHDNPHLGARGVILIQRVLPTVYSYTANRAGAVKGTGGIRMATSVVLWESLHRAGVPTCVVGTDGGGKSPLVREVVVRISATGRNVATHKPYRTVEATMWRYDADADGMFDFTGICDRIVAWLASG